MICKEEKGSVGRLLGTEAHQSKLRVGSVAASHFLWVSEFAKNGQ